MSFRVYSQYTIVIYNIEKALNRGIFTGLLSFVGDFVGGFGSGTGIIMAVSIINQFAEELGKEFAKTGRALPF